MLAAAELNADCDPETLQTISAASEAACSVLWTLRQQCRLVLCDQQSGAFDMQSSVVSAGAGMGCPVLARQQFAHIGWSIACFHRFGDSRKETTRQGRRKAIMEEREEHAFIALDKQQTALGF